MDFCSYQDFERLKDIGKEKYVAWNRINAKFMLIDISERTKKDDTRFFILTVCDQDVKNQITVFEPAMMEGLEVGKVYCCTMKLSPYDKAANGVSMIAESISPTSESPSEYRQVCRGYNEACNKINMLLSQYPESTAMGIARAILAEHWEDYISYGAASSKHHASFGGLLVHSVEVAEMALAIAEKAQEYNKNLEIRKDLLIAGALMHDVGKVRELDTNMTTGESGYNKESVLMTHIVYGIRFLEKCSCQLAGTYDEERLYEATEQLCHIIASHHRRKEYGSCITPATVEAEIVCIADDASATMFRYNDVIGELEPGDNKVEFEGKLDINGFFNNKR